MIVLQYNELCLEMIESDGPMGTLKWLWREDSNHIHVYAMHQIWTDLAGNIGHFNIATWR